MIFHILIQTSGKSYSLSQYCNSIISCCLFIIEFIFTSFMFKFVFYFKIFYETVTFTLLVIDKFSFLIFSFKVKFNSFYLCTFLTFSPKMCLIITFQKCLHFFLYLINNIFKTLDQVGTK